METVEITGVYCGYNGKENGNYRGSWVHNTGYIELAMTISIF